MQKHKPMKLVGKRSLHSKLLRQAEDYRTDADRLDGTPHWIVRDRLKRLSEQCLLLAVIVERKGKGDGQS